MSPPKLFGIRGLAAVATATVLTTLAVAVPVQAESIQLLPAPVDLRVEPDVPTRAESITARWTVPGGLPDEATAHWALCNDGDITLEPGEANGCGSNLSESLSSVTIPTPDEFAGTLWVWFRAPGREGLPKRVPVVIDRTAPGPPQNVRWENDVVRWDPYPQMYISFGRVHWKLCRGWTGYAEECVTGAGPEEPFALPAAMLAPASPAPAYCLGQQWNLRVWVEDAAGNVDLSPSNAGGIGGGMNPLCAPQTGDPKGDPPTPRTKTSLAIVGRLTATGKGSKRRKRLTVTATAKPVSAGGTVRLRVTGKQGKRTLNRTRSVRLANGRASYTLTVPKGFRRLSVKATYAGSKTHAPSSSRTMAVPIP